MAQDIVGSLFGPTPYEIQQNQRKAMDEMAWKYAQAEPFVGARAGLFSAAGGIAGAGADALGWKNPEVEQARAREAAMTGFDPSSSKSILEKAASVSDPKLKMQLQMLGNQRAKEEQAMALELRKQNFAEDEAHKLKVLAQQEKSDIARAQLAQQLEIAKMRSEDMRFSVQERAAAAREANHIKLMLGQLMNDTRLAAIEAKKSASGIEKPLTALQEQKLAQQMGKDRSMVGQIEADSAFLSSAIDRLKAHPGLSGITGISGYFPSAPQTPFTSGQAKAAETILGEIKGRTATLGRQMASQSGKLGNMAVQEWKIVSDSIANLDPKSPEFIQQLDNLSAQVRGLEARTKEAFDTTYAPYIEKNPRFERSGIPVTQPPAKATASPVGLPTQDAIAAELAKRPEFARMKAGGK